MSEAVTLAAVKAYLRIAAGDEDELLHRLIATATEACEQHIGRLVLARTLTETMTVRPGWQRLAAGPVTAITGVAAEGGGPLPVTDYAIDLAADGAGLVRVIVPGPARIAVTYRAGLAETVPAVPAALAQGIIRYVAHLHACRDEAVDAGPPAAVRGHWQPYRQVRLGGVRA